MCAQATRRNSKFQSSRPLDYVYDREWTLPPDVFAQDASKAVRALSTIVVRPDFRTMFSNRARHSVSIIPDRAAPYGMRAYRRLQWMKMASRSSQIDVQGRDSHRFRVRSCPRAVTDMQEAQAHVSSAARSNWRAVLRSPPTPVRHRSGKDQPRTVVITESSPSLSEEDTKDEPISGRRSSERVRMAGADEDESSGDSWVVAGSTPSRPRLKVKTTRIRGLSPSEETLIMLNRYERNLVREAWEAALPEVDQNQTDWVRRAALELELEKDKWALRSKEIEAINRARFLSEERDSKRRAALMKDFHYYWLTSYTSKNAKKLRDRLQSLRHNHQREVRKLQAEWCGVDKRRPRNDPVRFLVDPSYDGFAPQERFGEQAKRWHEYLPNRGKRFEDPKALQELEKCVVGNWKPSKFELAPPKERESPELCVYLTKWTPAKLKTLHADLKEIRKSSNRARCRFKPREWAQHTVTAENINTTDFRPRFVPLQEAKVYNAVLTLQRILRGRAVQSIMYRGRRHNRELIREILSSKPFDTGEEEPDVATRGLMASTGWPRLKTYDEYSQRPLQKKWVQQVLSSLPPTLDVYHLMDFVNMNLMKMRGHHDKSGENTETMPTPGPASSKGSKTSLEETAYISCGTRRPSKKRSMPRRKPPSERRISEEEINRCVTRVRPHHPRQGSATQQEEAEQPGVPSMAQEMGVHLARVETIQESRTSLQSVLNSTTANTVTCLAARPSTTESAVQGELRRNLSQRSTVEIHGRSSSHVGFRTGPWASRSPPNECPSTPASIDTVTAISRFTGEDFTDRRPDEEEFPGSFRPRPSAGVNVSASASEDTPSSDDTHIIADDATELVAAAFRAKVREQGNTLAAQRIDEAPSPTDSGNSSMIAVPILGRSVSEQGAAATLAYSASEEHARIIANTNSEATITTASSESSWTRNEAQQMSIDRRVHEKNRHFYLRVKGTIGGPKTKAKPQPNVEIDEENLPKKVD